MSAVLPTLLLMFVAFATPGPNNLFMTRTAAIHGMQAVAQAVMGVVAGGAAMLLLAHAGLSELVASAPLSRQLISLTGALVLAWAGLKLVLDAPRSADGPSAPDSVPRGAGHLFAFQFVNPKSWTLTLTVASSLPALHASIGLEAVLAVYGGFLLIPLACTLAWAAAGRAAATWLHTRARRIAFDRLMGLLLAGSAVLFLVQLGA